MGQRPGRCKEQVTDREAEHDNSVTNFVNTFQIVAAGGHVTAYE